MWYLQVWTSRGGSHDSTSTSVTHAGHTAWCVDIKVLHAVAMTTRQQALTQGMVLSNVCCIRTHPEAASGVLGEDHLVVLHLGYMAEATVSREDVGAICLLAAGPLPQCRAGMLTVSALTKPEGFQPKG